jgi:uncharacterized membrane protein (DUF485 family)
MENIISPQSSAIEPVKKPNRQYFFYQILVVFTTIEFWFYLLVYIFEILYFSTNSQPKSYFDVFSIPNLIFAQLTYLLGGILWFLIVKAILIIKNLISRQFIGISLWAGIISLLNPLIAASIYVFYLIAANIFVFHNPGADTLGQQQKLVFVAPVILLVCYFVFWKLHKSDKPVVAEDSTSATRDWVIAVLATLILAGLVWGANTELTTIRAKAIRENATQASLKLLEAGNTNLVAVKIDLTSISSTDRFNINLQWSSATPALQPGVRLFVIYGDNFVMSGQNAQGGQYVSQLRGECVVTKQNDGSYSCSVSYSSALLQYQNKDNYQFYTDFSAPKASDKVSQSMTTTDIGARNQQRKDDLTKLQQALIAYQKKNNIFPCTKDLIWSSASGSFDCKQIPAFDYRPYQNPPSAQPYYIYTNTNQNFNSGTQSFLAYTDLEPTKPNEKIVFCVDSNGVATELNTGPYLGGAINCKHVWPENLDQFKAK